jgi:hypothetical protein
MALQLRKRQYRREERRRRRIQRPNKQTLQQAPTVHV